MATIQLARQQQVTATVPQPFLQQPQAAGPDPIVAGMAEAASDLTSLTDKLAEQEYRQTEQLFQNKIAAELSQFETDSRARVIEFEATGTGDKPFVKGVLDDFEERAARLGEGYSEQLREEIKVKLLPIREQAATYALGVQQRRVNEEVLANAELFQNNVSNQVRFGAISEQAALAKVEEFAATVPDNLRLGVQTKIREQLRVASISRLSEANPADFMRRAKAGEFNDVDPTYVDRAYQSSASELLRRREKAERAMEKAQELASKDPLLAAQQSLALRGKQAPTREQLYAEQLRLGVHPADVAVVDKATANLYIKSLQSTQTLDDFRGMMTQIQANTIESGEDWKLLQKDLMRFAKQEDLPNLAQSMEVAANPAAYPLDTQIAVFEVMRDPKAAKTAEKLLDSDTKKRVQESVGSALSDHLQAMARSGASPQQLQQAQQFALDVATISAARTGKTDGDYLKNLVTPPEAISKLRFDNRNAYYVPAGLEKSFSPDGMEALRRKIILDGELDLPASFPSSMRANADFEDHAGWTTYGNVGVALTVDGVQVYAKGKPVIKTWEELSVDVLDAEFGGAIRQDPNAPAVRAQTPAGTGTIVLE